MTGEERADLIHRIIAAEIPNAPIIAIRAAVERIVELEEPHPCSGGRCPDPEAHAEGAHDL